MIWLIRLDDGLIILNFDNNQVRVNITRILTKSLFSNPKFTLHGFEQTHYDSHFFFSPYFPVNILIN